MCEPISMAAAMASLTIAQTVTGALGQKAQYEQNAANAQQSMQLQNKQTNVSIQQSEAANALKAQDAQTEMLKAAATARASANENGVTGNSIDALINDYHASEGRYLNSLDQQGSWDRSQAAVNKLGQKATAQRQINSVAKPSNIGVALRIGGDAVGAYDKYSRENR